MILGGGGVALGFSVYLSVHSSHLSHSGLMGYTHTVLDRSIDAGRVPWVSHRGVPVLGYLGRQSKSIYLSIYPYQIPYLLHRPLLPTYLLTPEIY